MDIPISFLSPRSRSALSRHRKRKLVDSGQHASSTKELESVIALASFSSASKSNDIFLRLRFQPGVLNDILRVLRNPQNSIYHRALAARALGLLMARDDDLKGQMKVDSDGLVDSLLQIINFCRQSKVQNADTRRIHVNCCLVISMMMQGPNQNLQVVVSLDSELLIMKKEPSEKNSRFLMNSIFGKPQTPLDVESGRTASRNSVISTAWTMPVPERKTPGDHSNTKATHHSRKLKSSKKDPRESENRVEEDEEEITVFSSHQPTRGASRKALHAVSHDNPTSLENAISSQPTPTRQYKLDRFRLITPAMVDTVPQSSQSVRSLQHTPLPVVVPSSLLGSRSSTVSATSESTESIFYAGRPNMTPSTAQSSLLNSKDMIQVLESRKMPLSTPEYFLKHLHDDHPHPPHSPSRIPVTDWNKWSDERKKAALDIFRSSQTDADQAWVDNADENVDEEKEVLQEVVGEIGLEATKSPAALRSAAKVSVASEAAPVISPPSPTKNKKFTSTASPDLSAPGSEEDVNTPEYKRMRLQEILVSPIEPTEANVVHLRVLANRVNTSVMTSLETEMESLRRQEAQMREKMSSFIQQERDKLPLKFLFQLPGGAIYCRQRMRRAVALWILMFEENQKRMALMQWKALVEGHRYRVRGAEYHRVVSLKRLQVAINYVIRGFQQQAMRKWIETTRLLIWLDRDTATRRIQTQVRRFLVKHRFLHLHNNAPFLNPLLRDIPLALCRHLPFQIDPRVREERRKIWNAATLVQRTYHRRRFKVFLQRYRDSTLKIQAAFRMWAARKRYQILLSRLIQYQALYRMHVCFQSYSILKKATLHVQHAFRNMRSRRLKRLILQAQRQQNEKKLTNILILQRFVRGYLARLEAKRLDEQNMKEFHAALVFQRCWYRYNNEWSTFLLLGCLREKENEENKLKKDVEALRKKHCAKQIQRVYRAHVIRRQGRCVLKIQTNFKRFKAQQFTQQKRMEFMAHRRIKWFFRKHHQRRIVQATKLQFWWLRCVPGRLQRHLHHRNVVQALERRRQLFELQYNAAVCIQAAGRGRQGRILACKERSARKIQKITREYLFWKHLQEEIIYIKKNVACQKAKEWIQSGKQSILMKLMQNYHVQATIIQKHFRGIRCRNALIRCIVRVEFQERMVRRIQIKWRANAQKRIAFKILQLQKRKLINPFRDCLTIQQVLTNCLKKVKKWYDPQDELNGLSIPSWLRRLGLDTKYLTHFIKKSPFRNLFHPDISVDLFRSLEINQASIQLKELMGCQDEIITNEEEKEKREEDLQIMMTNLFASKILSELGFKRKELMSLNKRLVHLQSLCTMAQRRFELEQIRLQEVTHVLDEIEKESQDFRHPPKALKRKKNQIEKQIEILSKQNLLLQTKFDQIKAILQKNQQHQNFLKDKIQNLEKKEIACLFTLQNFQESQDLNIPRQMFLEKFPSLGARAVKFATSFDNISFTRWQIMRFLDQYETVSEIQLHMKQLTFFSMENERIKYDKIRFHKSNNLFQAAFEKICELLDLSIEKYAFVNASQMNHLDEKKTSFLQGQALQALWETTCMFTTNKTKENIMTYWKHAQKWKQMNDIVVLTQSLWRRKKAKRFMMMLRKNTTNEKIKQQYIEERHQDKVILVWQAEKEKEKKELEQFQKEEAKRLRLEQLYEIIRFPYQIKEEQDPLYSGICTYWIPPKEGEYEDEQAVAQALSIAQQTLLTYKPVYTIEEEDAVIKIQKLIRAYRARIAYLFLQREQLRQEKRDTLAIMWETTREDRSRDISIRLELNVQTKSTVQLWRQRQKEKAIQTNKSNPNRSAVTAVPSTTTASTTKIEARSKLITAAAFVRPKGTKIQQNDSGGGIHEAMTNSNILLEQLSPNDRAHVQKMDILLKEFDDIYHKSVRADHKRNLSFPLHSRPPNVHGRMIVQLLNKYQEFLATIEPHVSAKMRLEYTRVGIRFGWTEIRNPNSINSQLRSYYLNEMTQETTWERPEYDFDEEYAALKIQSFLRMCLGKIAFKKVQGAINFVQIVRDYLKKASKVGWIGYGLEGISTLVYLSRLGLSKYASSLGKLEIEDLAKLSENKIKKLSLTKEEVALIKSGSRIFGTQQHKKKKKYPLSNCDHGLAPSEKSPFNFLPNERVLQHLISQSFPNQQGRILGLVKAVKSSKTPISYRQLEMHLRKYAGRPDEALENIGEIASLNYATQSHDEQNIYQLYIKCINRCIVCAANLKLLSLKKELQEILQVAASLVVKEDPSSPSSSDLTVDEGFLALAADTKLSVEKRIAQALTRHPKKNVKGMWENYNTSVFSYSQAALYLREEAIERVLVWVRSCLICQSTFKMHLVQRWYIETQIFRGGCATKIQGVWRVYCAKELRSFMQTQQRSEYEQLYDREKKDFYYIYKPTRERMDEEPRDHLGNIIPYRPMVQDRATKRWVQAWPRLNPNIEETKEPDDDDDDFKGSVPCSICHAEKATRRCNECYSPSGDYLYYCFVCFCEHHAPENTETYWHAYTALNRLEAPVFQCTECKRYSTMRCLKCNEHYCDRCFQRLHAKGKRTSHKCEYYEAMATICIECETKVAYQLCLVCKDPLCEDCMQRTHSKGKKASHDMKLIKQTLEEGHLYCDQCHSRRGDARCEYCSMTLCQLCLRDKHAMICLETELSLKKKAVLGDNVCAECGKPSDRVCETCGDRYCSVRWMGNPGCFERFHGKGKRADHTFAMLEVPPLPQEIIELEDKVKQKRKLDAEKAEAEAKRFAEMLALEEERAAKELLRLNNAKLKEKEQRQAARRPRKQSAGNLGVGPNTAICTVENCSRVRLQEKIPFCAVHLTPQHAFEFTKDPVEAARLLDEVGQALEEMEKEWKRPGILKTLWKKKNPKYHFESIEK